ncbi:MAG TPA: hypothetical protein VLU46_10595, partial [Thermoanaerobaculia bacterium]|nr:hypothetical protein [Thermoanaerobaculia bacterium]
MPKFLFYTGTAFCLFLALTSAAESLREVQGTTMAFAAVQTSGAFSVRAPWAIVVGFIAGLAVAVIFVRMAALLAARNLFGAFLALFCITGAIASLTGVLLLESRMLAAAHRPAVLQLLSEMHLVGFFVLGYFVSLSLLAMRPYFRIQASRMLSALVFLPLPIFALVMAQELFVHASTAPMPARTPASLVFFSVVSILFFAIALHCIRHRHLFLEMTNLRELLEGRFDPTLRGTPRPIGG